VWGFWLVEIKPLFSVALLCFENGSREAYHEHAFNSWSLVLKGELEEDVAFFDRGAGFTRLYGTGCFVHTPRECCHKVKSVGRTWVLTFRGPWADRWREWLPKERRYQTLTHGRKVVG
jgi:quercetin dioxygenase-like cupin family protein